MEITAYNLAEVRARNLLAMTPKSDLFIQKEIPCKAKVHIVNPFFEFNHDRKVYQGSPVFLHLESYIDEVFIEPDEDRTFPSGTKSFLLTSVKRSGVNIEFNTSQRGALIARGVEYADYKPPAILNNNTMDIPCQINLYSIYETPMWFVEILDAENIQTTLDECGYVGLIEMCEYHPNVLKELAGEKVRYVSPNEYYQSKYEIEDDYTPEEEQVAEQAAIEGEEADPVRAIANNSFDDIIKKREQEREVAEENQKSGNGFNASEFLKGVYEDDNAEKQANTGRDMYGNYFNADKTDRKGKLPYEKLKDKLKAEEVSRQVDIALDNQAMNAGVTDISGFGASTEGDVQRAKSEKENKEKIERARRLDVAQDNMALNSGSTDIAGAGSGHNGGDIPKAPSSQQLLQGLFGGKPTTSEPSTEPSKSSDSPQYL